MRSITVFSIVSALVTFTSLSYSGLPSDIDFARAMNIRSLDDFRVERFQALPDKVKNSYLNLSSDDLEQLCASVF